MNCTSRHPLYTPNSQTYREELKEYGVDARPLDMLSSAAGWDHVLNGECTGATANDKGPVLLVSTLANTRGLDLPDLSHVFVLGVPEGKVHSYTHIAGRTGRFGKSGKIVTVVEKIKEEVNDGMGGRKKRAVKDEERKMNGDLERDEDYSTESRALRLVGVTKRVSDCP